MRQTALLLRAYCGSNSIDSARGIKTTRVNVTSTLPYKGYDPVAYFIFKGKR
jgi:hypothetical protein